MSRIVTNVQSLIAQRVLTSQNGNLNQALNRLSTGLRINSGKDDPAGLIASETLRAEKTATLAAIDNARRADTVMAVAEGALVEINRLLLELEDLIDRSSSEAGLSESEVEANQSQIDSILQSIDRIANSTEFAGKKIIGGDFAYTTSGVNSTNLTDVHINAAKIPTGSYKNVTVEVSTGSTYAYVSGTGGGASGALSAATTLQVRGIYGTETFSFASGTSAASIATSIRSATSLTGVSAIVSGSDVYFTSTTYGSDAIVSVTKLSGLFTIGDTSDTGSDGTILVNGVTADVNGLEVKVRDDSVNADLILGASFGSTASSTQTFQITDGGALFAIAPEVSLTGIATIGIENLTTSTLGKRGNGFLYTLGSGETNALSNETYATAQRIVRDSQEQISSLRGRIGAFQKNTLATAVNSLLIAYENTAAAESAIRETDFAEATSALTRAQILVNSSTASLQLANAQPQNVLALLG